MFLQPESLLSGERASLQAILDTGLVRCPRPRGVFTEPGSGRAVLVTEYLHMRMLRSKAAVLGKQIARWDAERL